jgi:hypothetical protein
MKWNEWLSLVTVPLISLPAEGYGLWNSDQGQLTYIQQYITNAIFSCQIHLLYINMQKSTTTTIKFLFL